VAWERLETVAYRDEQGTELHDLNDKSRPGGGFFSLYRQVALRT
jgi:hypothetical protein